MKIAKTYDKSKYTKDQAIEAFTYELSQLKLKLIQYGLTFTEEWNLKVDEMTEADKHILTWNNSAKDFTTEQSNKYSSFVSSL